jgi:hypothetical protein
MQVDTVIASGGTWLRALICTEPTGTTMARAAALAYAAARTGPFGLAIDDRGYLVAATWIDSKDAADRAALSAGLQTLAEAWRSVLGVDQAAPKRFPGHHAESRIRNELLRSL